MRSDQNEQWGSHVTLRELSDNRLVRDTRRRLEVLLSAADLTSSEKKKKSK